MHNFFNKYSDIIFLLVILVILILWTSFCVQVLLIIPYIGWALSFIIGIMGVSFVIYLLFLLVETFNNLL
jgi:MFS superfamily sulfate permease-like transporter